MSRELLYLFGGVLALLVVSSIAGRLLRRRARTDAARATMDNLVARVKAWWIMCGVFAITLAVGRAGSLMLFGLLSFLALREFITLTHTHRADHRTLFWAFFVFTPAQYWLVGVQWYGMFALLIPVYAFLFVAARVSGWSAHIIEQLEHNRLIRPRSRYIGPEIRKVQPLAARG